MPIENITPDVFTLLLRGFHKLVEDMPPVDKVQPELLKLKQAATNSAELTVRQREAVIDRCNNYINGDYGKTKTAENLGHEKQEKIIPPSNGKHK